MRTKETQGILLNAAIVITMVFSFSVGLAAGAVGDDGDSKADSTAASAADENGDATKAQASAESTDQAPKDPSDSEDDSNGEVASEDEVKQLSAPIETYPIYGEQWPDWIQAANTYDEHQAELIVFSVPSISADASLESLQEQQEQALNTYLDQNFKVDGLLKQVRYSREYITENLIDSSRVFDGKVEMSSGEMHQHASVLVLDKAFHKDARSKWEDLEVSQRLIGIGALAGIMFAGLLASTALLKSISPRKRSTASTDESKHTANV